MLPKMSQTAGIVPLKRLRRIKMTKGRASRNLINLRSQGKTKVNMEGIENGRTIASVLTAKTFTGLWIAKTSLKKDKKALLKRHYDEKKKKLSRMSNPTQGVG